METIFNKNSRKSQNKIPLLKNLIEIPIGKQFQIFRVNAGYHAKRRLACLGILPGVKVIKKKAAPFRGPIELDVKGASIVIGRGLASKIVVIDEKTS